MPIQGNVCWEHVFEYTSETVPDAVEIAGVKPHKACTQ